MAVIKLDTGRYAKNCPSCGKQQTYLRKNYAEVSIDRIDSSFGYLKENIQLVDKRVNMMKQSYSQEEFILVCKAVADKVKW